MHGFNFAGSRPVPEYAVTSRPRTRGLATCPLCHTQDPSMTNLAVSAGVDWQCSRCGSRWDAVRLATVAAYAVWLAAHTSSVDPALHAGAAG